jgi:hypothetical protein
MPSSSRDPLGVGVMSFMWQRRCARRKARAALVAALVVALAPAAVPLLVARAQVPEAPAFSMEGLQLTDRDGASLHILHYRPRPPATSGVLLVRDLRADAATCGNALAQQLAQAGFEVLAPDPRGEGGPGTPSESAARRARPARPELAALRDDLARCWPLFDPGVRDVALVCLGWSGLSIAGEPPAPLRASGIVWIGPHGEVGAWDQALRAQWQPLPALLLVAGREDLESSRVAESLFARLNDACELRLFSRGASACALAENPHVRAGLLDWLRALMPRSDAAR